METKFKERINYTGKLEDISIQICKDFNLGKFKANELILVGYEDFNFVIETDKGKYFVKIFSKHRNLVDCKRYVEIMTKAIDKEVSTPKLLKSEQGALHLIAINNAELRLCVMEYIEGKDLYQTNYSLNSEEIKFIAHQAALINSIDLKPEPDYDSWAIPNFIKEYEKGKDYLSSEDKELLEPLIKKFKELKIENLPHCFVHGDILKTNVIKDSKNKVWILDFSVSNYYPRIQELAILACNILFDEKDKNKSQNNFKTALEEYQKTIKLTDSELAALDTYIELAHAMHILGATRERVEENNDSEENEYWYDQGKKGLEQVRS